MIISREKAELTNPKAVYDHIRKIFNKRDSIEREKEHFFVAMLNTRSKVKCVDLVCVGTLNASLVHPREVFRRAVTMGACSIILAHNHPSGDVEPSDEDLKITKKLVEAGNILGISVLDHVIIGNREYSFKENGHI